MVAKNECKRNIELGTSDLQVLAFSALLAASAAAAENKRRNRDCQRSPEGQKARTSALTGLLLQLALQLSLLLFQRLWPAGGTR